MGLEHIVETPLKVPQPRVTDLEHLTDYLLGTFRNRIAVLAKLQANPIEYKYECLELLRMANFFHLELIGWYGVANRLYTEAFATRLTDIQSSASDRLKEQKGMRPTAAMIEARAKEEITPLEDAISRIEETMKLCDKLASSAQTIIRSMQEDEISGRAAGGDSPDWGEFVEAPIEGALKRLKRD